MKKLIREIAFALVCAVSATIALTSVFTSQVDAQTTKVTSKGREFWIGFMSNQFGGSGTPLTVFITADSATNGTLSIPAIGFSQTFTVAANGTTSINLSRTLAELTNSEQVQNKAVRVETDKDVAVFALNLDPATSDATLVYQALALGSQYVVYGSRNEGVFGNGQNAGLSSTFSVVATTDNTSVEITPSVALASGRAPGVPFTITLNRGQGFQIRANSATGLNLSGTSVKSNNPIAVFSGSQCTDIGGCAACDHLFEQVSPQTNLGKEFVTVPFLTRQQDRFEAVATVDGTIITRNGVPFPSLNAGQVLIWNSSTSDNIVSNNPIGLTQFSLGSVCDGAQGDPFTIQVPPVDQSLDRLVFNAFTSASIANYFANIVSPTSATSGVLLDGAPLADWIQVPNRPEFSFNRVRIAQGNHIIEANCPQGSTTANCGVIVSVYAYGNFDSYGYLGGVRAETINPVDGVRPECAGSNRFGETNLILTRSDANVDYLVNNREPRIPGTGGPMKFRAAYGLDGGEHNWIVRGINRSTGDVITFPSVKTIVGGPIFHTRSIMFTQTARTSMTLRLQTGSGEGRLILAKQGTVRPAEPDCGKTYPFNTDFSQCPECTTAVGSKVVGNLTGTQNTLTVTGLTPGTQYTFWVIEYDNALGQIVYNNKAVTGTSANPRTGVTLRAVKEALAFEETEQLFNVGPVSPNPSSDESVFAVNVDEPDYLEVDVFDAIGNKVLVVCPQFLAPEGLHEFSLNSKDLAPGSYIVNARLGHRVSTSIFNVSR